jgi:hypothetical protein
MSRTLTASDRSALIRLASTLPKGSTERRIILAELLTSVPDRVELLQRIRQLRNWSGAAGMYVFDVPLPKNPTRYSLVRSPGGGWYVTVRMPHGKGSGDRMFLLPDGNEVLSRNMAEAALFPTERAAIEVVWDHASHLTFR